VTYNLERRSITLLLCSLKLYRIGIGGQSCVLEAMVMPKTTLIVTTGFGEVGTEAQLGPDAYFASCGG